MIKTFEDLPKDLYCFGFKTVANGDEKHLNKERVEKIADWICCRFDKSNKLSIYSSYALKHTVERNMGEYVANGEFIAAMIILGFRYKRESPTSPNCRFYMDDSSLETFR